jgi:hypothetical protein
MIQADSVHSTPPLRTSVHTDVPAQSSRRNFIAQVVAVSAAAGALGMTLPLPTARADPVKIEAVRDPIFAAIEGHRRARTEFLAAVTEHGACEREIPSSRRQSSVDAWEENIVETDDPRWIAAEKNTIRASNSMDDTAIALLDVTPTTISGVAALLNYVVAVEEDGDGHIAWPDRLIAEGEPNHALGKIWACFLHRNLADSLQAIVDGVQA